MALPNSNDLKAKTPKENLDHDSRIENLKSGLILAYKSVKKAKKKSHLKNKRLCDQKGKLRSIQTGDIIYLYNPSKKPGNVLNFTNSGKARFKLPLNCLI